MFFVFGPIEHGSQLFCLVELLSLNVRGEDVSFPIGCESSDLRLLFILSCVSVSVP